MEAINNSCFTEFGRALARGEFRKLSPLSLEYTQLWQEQLNRCIQGYEVGGKKMTGRLYAYVNFGTLVGFNAKGDQDIMTPSLRDVEWLVFGQLQRAIEERKNLFWMSGRRGGKSYIMSFNASYIYTFYENGKSILGGYESNYADLVMEKARNHLDGFRIKETQFYKSRIKDQYRSELVSGRQEKIDGAWVTIGSGSAITNVCFKNNPNAALGHQCTFIGIDEVGKFEKLLEMYQATDPLLKQGGTRNGLMMLAGTGGDMEKGTVDAFKMFNDPETYDLLTFWDDQAYASKKGYYMPSMPFKIDRTPETPSAFFIPAYMLMEDEYRDENGNTDIPRATAYYEKERERRKTGKDLVAYTQYLQFYPFTIAEVFMSSSQNIFPIGLLQDQIERIMRDKQLVNMGIKGELVMSEGKVEFRPGASLREADFPINKSRSNEGCVVIYEEPHYQGERIPDKLYIAGTDPYAQDQADTSPSLGSTFIYKRFFKAGVTHDKIVAEYTGRPKTSDEYYENVRKLLIYYNARCLYENNIPGMKQYFERKNSLHLLFKEPAFVKDVILETKVVRGYGINMSAKMKSYVIEAIKDWLLTEYDENRYNLERVFSLNLLKELVNYNPDGNFDRVIAFGLCVIQDLSHHKKSVKDVTEQDKDFFENLFNAGKFKQTVNDYRR